MISDQCLSVHLLIIRFIHLFVHSVIQKVTGMYQAPVKCWELDFFSISYFFGSGWYHRVKEHYRGEGKLVLKDWAISLAFLSFEGRWRSTYKAVHKDQGSSFSHFNKKPPVLCAFKNPSWAQTVGPTLGWEFGGQNRQDPYPFGPHILEAEDRLWANE